MNVKAWQPEPMPARFQVVAIAVRQHPADQLAVGENIEADRRFGGAGVLRPAGDAARADAVDVTAQRAELRRIG